MGMYFDRDVDAWIVEYCKTESHEQKSEIFEKKIMPAFVALIENQLQIYKFFKIDDKELLKNECLSHLYEILPKFDPNKGKKGFSYFNVVVKHWFINKTREKQKYLKQQVENIYGIDHEIVKNDPSIVLSSYETEVLEREFWHSLLNEMEIWLELLKKEQEIQVLNAIIFLLRNPNSITIFNKKAVHFYIKEITGLTAKQVNHHINKLKEMYLEFREDFHGEED